MVNVIEKAFDVQIYYPTMSQAIDPTSLDCIMCTYILVCNQMNMH